MPTITFMPMNKTFTVSEGTTILEAAIDGGVNIQHDCGGNCICATCHVYVIKGLEALSQMDDLEDTRLDDVSNRQGKSRLACQARIVKPSPPVVVQIPT